MLLQRVPQLVIAEIKRLGGLPLVIAAAGQCLLQHRLFEFLRRHTKIGDIDRLAQIG